MSFVSWLSKISFFQTFSLLHSDIIIISTFSGKTSRNNENK